MADIEEVIKFLLSNDRERKVLESLSTGEKSFTELKTISGIKHNAELSRTLKNLGKYVLFDHVYKRSQDDKVFSYYETNQLGREALEMTKGVEGYIARLKTKRVISTKITPCLSFPIEEVVGHA